MPTAMRISGILNLNYSDLEPWTLYNIRVALYTSLVVNGTGPWSEWRLVQTLQSGKDTEKLRVILDLLYKHHF